MRMQYNLLPLLEEDKDEDKPQRGTRIRVILRSNIVEALEKLLKAIVSKEDFKAQFELIAQSINRQKLDEIERTKQISNRLKKEATIFQLIKYSNHLVSIFPILQTMNYIEA